VEQDRILLEILANHVASVIGRIRKVSELGKAIEDRELAERELLEYTETLSEAVEEKTREVLDLERMSAAGKVAAMVGHDLRGPLQTIKNALYLMERNPEEGAEFRKVVDEAVNYAVSMLEELRLNVGDTPLQLQEVNLGALIRRVVDEASIPDSVEAEVHVDDGLGSVSMDPLKIRRVLDNLVRNAVEAMPDGGTLGVSAVCDGDVVFVRVRDTGTGIPEELMPELFKAFVTTKPQGMGLGLAYCKRAVEAHGGTIVAQSKAGEGTTIIFEIPTETS
jgi:two-component system sporulation sensor kinase A